MTEFPIQLGGVVPKPRWSLRLIAAATLAVVVIAMLALKLAQLQVTSSVEGRAMSVPVAVLDPPAWVRALESGDEVLVVGHVRRRFFRVAGATASRVEIVAETVAPARDRRRLRTVRRRVEELLEAIVM